MSSGFRPGRWLAVGLGKVKRQLSSRKRRWAVIGIVLLSLTGIASALDGPQYLFRVAISVVNNSNNNSNNRTAAKDPHQDPPATRTPSTPSSPMATPQVVVKQLPLSGQPTETPTPSPSCAKSLEIDSPPKNMPLKGQDQQIVIGKKCGPLNGMNVFFWLGAKEPGTGIWRYYSPLGPPKPIMFDSDGDFRVSLNTIGNPGDIDREYFLILILADQSCSSLLQSTTPTSGAYLRTDLLNLDGCNPVVNMPVHVTRPKS